MSTVQPEFKKYASLAWRFLNINGYINFGVAPAIWKRALDTPDTRGTVVVVGAGMAGDWESGALTVGSVGGGMEPRVEGIKPLSLQVQAPCLGLKGLTVQ